LPAKQEDGLTKPVTLPARFPIFHAFHFQF
jgi:hypothetical protein